MQNQRAKGFCFLCEEKYVPKHRFKKKIHMIIVINNDFMNQDEEMNLKKNMDGKLTALKVSLNSLDNQDFDCALQFK